MKSTLRVQFWSTPQGVDYLNIGLIFLSLFLAIRLPFELFLFSYAVLGPLHYLTEINWLRERRFFSAGRYDWIWLSVLSFLIFMGFFSTEYLQASSDNPHGLWAKFPALKPLAAFLERNSASFVFLAFGLAGVFTFLKKVLYRLAGAVIILALAMFFSRWTWYGIVFGMFIPTIIHVCIFTGLFMLYGALRHKSIPGLMSFFALLLAVIIILKMNASAYAGRVPSQSVINVYFSSKFQYLNLILFKLLAPAVKVKQYLETEIPWAFMNTVYGWRIQTLIAFSYTYHYLNWFSKTGIIKWHHTPKSFLALAGCIWLISLSLYAYDYHIGLVALFFLSVLHVFLEFPLNFQSMAGIWRSLFLKG